MKALLNIFLHHVKNIARKVKSRMKTNSFSCFNVKKHIVLNQRKNQKTITRPYLSGP